MTIQLIGYTIIGLLAILEIIAIKTDTTTQ